MIRRGLFVVLICCAASASWAQGTASTGEARDYPSRRTTGIVDPGAPLVFEDVTPQTALNNYLQTGGDRARNYILETASGAVAVFDYDNDDRPDIFLLNGSSIAALAGKAPAPRSALYRNLGGWEFEDVTEKAGVANERWGTGAAVGDFNNDGFADLFVSNYGAPRLYQNNGDGTFTDVAERLGLNVKGWLTGASFGDYDRDGRLDLFVPGYVDFSTENLPPSPADISAGGGGGSGNATRNLCRFRGQPVMCGPRGLPGARDYLFRQKTDGTFEDVSDKTGAGDRPRYFGFSSVFVDADDDGWLDILVVNDSTPKQLYRNKRDGTFEEIGHTSGIALNESGREQAGMGLGVGDYDNDGRVDFHITNFSDDSNTLYHNDGDGNFSDATARADLIEPTMPFLGWGTSFFDYDNDGWKDILVVNGHVYPEVDKFQWGTSFAQQILLFKNIPPDEKADRIRFERIGAHPQSALAKSYTGRGLAVSDFDGDGKIDFVAGNLEGPPALVRNVGVSTNNWLSLKLVGEPAKKTPKDATGSVIFVTCGKLRQRFEVVSGASYASQNDRRLHIGLGRAAKIDKLEIRWAGGATETFEISDVNRAVTVQEAKGVINR